jgi:hypothetical protein
MPIPFSKAETYCGTESWRDSIKKDWFNARVSTTVLPATGDRGSGETPPPPHCATASAMTYC